MKNIFIIFILLFSIKLQAVSVDTIILKSKITEVTLFTNGAQVTRIATGKISKDKHLLVFEKLPRELEPQSIQVKNIDNCTILSVKHYLSNNIEQNTKNAQKAIQDKIDKQEFRIKEINAKLSVYASEQKLLLDNSIIARKNEGSAISEIKEAADYYRLRLTEIKQDELMLEKEYDEIKIKIQELYVQMNEIMVNSSTTYSKIYVAIESEKESTVEISLSYFINSAGWQPLYDFRVDDISKPLIIDYNANIYQSSGEDWNNVNIKLSNSNPTLSGEKPELGVWYIERNDKIERKSIRGNYAAIRGRIVDKENRDPLPFVNVTIEKNGIQFGGGVTDADGNYVIKPIEPGTYDIKATFLGYKPVQIKSIPLLSGVIQFQNIEMESSAQEIESVTITKYSVPLIDRDRTSSGSTVSADEIMKMPSRNASSIATNVGGVFSQDGEVSSIRGQRSYGESNYEINNIIANTTRNNVTNLEYSIEIPYSIPSDGADYTLKIKEVKSPVNYIYYSVPKLDNEVFLTAELKDWTQLNLLSGKSSIYFQGTFTGESYIDASQTSDTLHISLGRDNNILVKREGKKNSEKKFIGNNIKEIVGWDYTVKNNRNVPVKVFVEDQYPITERKSIEIELLESSGAKVDTKTGKLIWELLLSPDEKKTFTLSYSVKYPRYQVYTAN